MTVLSPGAESAYATLAPHYEAFARHFRHDRWLLALERLALDHGLRGRRVLDVACGTGKSSRPLAARGYEVVGCDVSAEMLQEAAALAPAIELHHADMRALPVLGVFDWVTCLNDALNYVLEEDDLRRALTSMAAQLRPGGLMTFDLNSLSAHREGLTSTFVVEEETLFMCWRGRGTRDASGEPGAADISIFERRGDRWSRVESSHEQRWWSRLDVEAACDAAGLEVLAVRGQLPGARLQAHASETEHSKLVYLLRRPAAPDPEPKEVSP